MSVVDQRHDTDRDIEEVFGLVPDFFQNVPDYLLPTEWASFKSLMLSDQTAIPNKYKEMIGLAVSGATPLPLLRLLPRRGGAAIRRHRGGDQRDRVDCQAHDGMEH